MRSRTVAIALALATTGLFDAGFAAHRRTPPNDDAVDGSICDAPDSVLSIGCGIATDVGLEGQAVRSAAAGVLELLRGVDVYSVAETPGSMERGTFLTRTDSEGRFRVTRTVSYSAVRRCTKGVVTTEKRLGSARLLLRAKGCEDTVIEVPADQPPQRYEIGCSR